MELFGAMSVGLDLRVLALFTVLRLVHSCSLFWLWLLDTVAIVVLFGLFIRCWLVDLLGWEFVS